MEEYEYQKLDVEKYIDEFIAFCKRIGGTPRKDYEVGFTVVHCDLPGELLIKLDRVKEPVYRGKEYVDNVFRVDIDVYGDKYRGGLPHLYGKYIELFMNNTYVDEYQEATMGVTTHVSAKAKKISLGVHPVHKFIQITLS